MSRVSFLPLLLNEDCSLRFTPLVEPFLRTLLPAFNTASTVRLVACLASRLLTSLHNTDGTFFPVCRLVCCREPPLPPLSLSSCRRPLPFCRIGRIDLAIVYTVDYIATLIYLYISLTVNIRFCLSSGNI